MVPAPWWHQAFSAGPAGELATRSCARIGPLLFVAPPFSRSYPAMLHIAARAPRPETASAACFSVHARAEPGVMPRVLELFAKRGLVPSSWHSSTSGVDDGELTIDIQMRGMERELADYVAACLRQIADVEVVLISQKR
jgi:acetolactate synthase regulatory subunit